MDTLKTGLKSSELWVMVAPVLLDKLKAFDTGVFTSDQIVLLLIVYIGGRTALKLAQVVVAAFGQTAPAVKGE